MCSDVFIYIGDLSEVFRLIKSRNSKAGKLVFSTEHNDSSGYTLEKTGRYSHSKSTSKAFVMNLATVCRPFQKRLSGKRMVNF